MGGIRFIVPRKHLKGSPHKTCNESLLLDSTSSWKSFFTSLANNRCMGTGQNPPVYILYTWFSFHRNGSRWRFYSPKLQRETVIRHHRRNPVQWGRFNWVEYCWPTSHHIKVYYNNQEFYFIKNLINSCFRAIEQLKTKYWKLSPKLCISTMLNMLNLTIRNTTWKSRPYPRAWQA